MISSPVNEHVTRLDLSRRNGAGLLEQLSGELGPLNALIVKSMRGDEERPIQCQKPMLNDVLR